MGACERFRCGQVSGYSSTLWEKVMIKLKCWTLFNNRNYFGIFFFRVKAGTIVGIAANISCLLSVLLQSYMPEVSKTIQEQLNAPPECNVVIEKFVSYLPTGHKIGQVTIELVKKN